MRAVIQRVTKASVTVKGELISSIKTGFLVLLAIKTGDTKEQGLKLAEKIANLRIIEDGEGKMNLSLLNQGGEILLVSQFTLYGNTEKGNRPSFIDSAGREEAKALMKIFTSKLESLGIPVAQGSFGEHMQVELVNDGPTTIIIDA